MKKKVSELEGAELDYFVAKAEGKNARIAEVYDTYPQQYECYYLSGQHVKTTYLPSSSWKHGGPIIEREQLALGTDHNRLWYSQRQFETDAGTDWRAYWGKTPLIAAMRCFVASRFGEEVDSEELGK